MLDKKIRIYEIKEMKKLYGHMALQGLVQSLWIFLNTELVLWELRR